VLLQQQLLLTTFLLPLHAGLQLLLLLVLFLRVLLPTQLLLCAGLGGDHP
jgi:hypothetical protein